MAKKSKDKWVLRSADTGQFVTKQYAQNNPSTTIKQRVAARPVPPVPKKKANRK